MSGAVAKDAPAGFAASPATYPPRRPQPLADPRFLELFQDDPASADILLAGVPFDGAVLGRKGAAGGPTGIREAFRFLSTYDPETGLDLAPLRLHDLGDVRVDNADVLATHAAVERTLAPAFATRKPLVILGGDNSLSTPHVQALAQARPGQAIGLVVLDAHYDLRPMPADGIPTSGTPYRRLLEAGTVEARRLVEVGIRPFANSASLAHYAAQKGVHIVTRGELARQGAGPVAAQAVATAGQGAAVLWLSVDVDALDQSVACGVSAPGAGGVSFAEAATLVRAVAQDPRCAGMDLVETAPALDPTGNTARTAAQLVAEFCAGVVLRVPQRK